MDLLGVKVGQSTPHSKKMPKKSEKEGKKRENQEEKAKIGKGLVLCPPMPLIYIMMMGKFCNTETLEILISNVQKSSFLLKNWAQGSKRDSKVHICIKVLDYI